MNTTFELIAWMPGPWEIAVIGVLGLLIFGKRLPEVGKSLGKSIVEFKKGLRGIEDDIDKAVDQSQADMLPPPSQQHKTSAADGESPSQTGSTEQENTDSYANTTDP